MGQRVQQRAWPANTIRPNKRIQRSAGSEFLDFPSVPSPAPADANVRRHRRREGGDAYEHDVWKMLAIGNPTGAMGVMDFLGEEYRSALGLPVINIPGCAPVGDNFTETVAAILLYLQGLGPLPEFDELGRPAWLFGETVHRGCTRAGFYEEGVFAEAYGDKECLVEIGCWGPVVQCNINKRGAISHMGGCMNVGAPCIGCTMPSFPDGFSPFYKRPPGTLVSSTASRTHGFIIRKLRENTRFFQNRTHRWAEQGHVPSGWGHIREPKVIEKMGHYFYQKLQFLGAKSPGAYLEEERKAREKKNP